MIELITPYLLDTATYTFAFLFNIRLGIVLQGLYYKALNGEPPTKYDKLASYDWIAHILFVLAFYFQIFSVSNIIVNSELLIMDILVNLANYHQEFYLKICRAYLFVYNKICKLFVRA